MKPTFDQFAAKAQELHPGVTEAQIREAWGVNYGGAAVRTQGPSREDYAARARSLYPDVGDDQIDEAYETKYGAGFLTEAKRTLLSQAYAPLVRATGAITGGVAGALSKHPLIPDFEQPAADVGFGLYEHANRVQDANAPSADLATRSPWNPYKIGVNTVGAIGQMGSQILSGGAGIVGLQIDDAARVEEELLAKGVSPTEARARAVAYAMVAGGLERIGLGRLMPKRLPGRIKAGAQEAATELGQNVVRNVTTKDAPFEDFGDAIAGEGIPAFLAAALLARGGRQQRQAGDKAADKFARDTGLDGTAPPPAAAPDRAGPEPLRDIAAQVAEVGKTRRGVYLSPAQGDVPVDPGLAEVPTPDGGRMLVREEEAAELAAALENADEATRQEVIGTWTGAGAGKPINPDAVIVQATRGGAVVRETVVEKGKAEATRKAYEKEFGQARITTAQEALTRRARIIENEDKSPFLELGADELLKRGDPKGYLKGVVDQRALPKREELPPEVGAYFEPSENAALVDVAALVRTKPQDASSTANGLKRMAAAARGEIGKRGPITVKVDELGRLNVTDGNGTAAAAKYAKLPQVPAEIELDTTTPEAKALERRLTPAARAELAGLARDAQAFMPTFEATLEALAEQLTGVRRSVNHGVGARVAKIKSNGPGKWNRIVEKVVAEEGGDPRALKDMARATIYVENRQQAQQALDALLEAFGQAPGTSVRRTLLDAQNFEQVIARDPYGYADVKLNIQGPNGRVYEVQISQADLGLAKETGGHKLYEEGRKLEGKVRDALMKIVGRRLNAASPDQVLRAVDMAVEQFRTRDPQMRKFYEKSRALYRPAWERFLAASATDSQSARQAASSMASPSSLMAEGSDGMNTPSASDLSPTNPDTIAGSPSTLKNSLSTTSSSSTPGASVANNLPSHKVATPSGVVIEVRPKFVELDALLTSDRPGYPARFQPRERGDRAALSQQVAKIARELTPWRLGTSRSTDDGASIVDGNNLVESGNGRILALRLAQQQHPENFAAYQQFVADEARRLGVDVSGMSNPVLVQERTTPLTDQEVVDFTIDANRNSKASMSPTELARADSTLLTPEMLTILRSGDLTQAQNAEFVNLFVSKLPDGQDLAARGGQANADAQQRAEAAMVAKAYGAERAETSFLLDRLYETADEGVRRLTNALKLASFKFSELRLSIESGKVAPEYDITGELLLAYNQVREGRLRGMTLKQILDQGDLTMSPERAKFLEAFVKADGKEQPTEVIAAQLMHYAQQANMQRLDQASIFGDERIAPVDILASSVELLGRNEATIEKDGTFLAARPWPSTRGVPAWGVTQTLKRLQDGWNPEVTPYIRVVQSPAELPDNVLAVLGPGVNGATDLDTGTVYIVADNLRDQYEAERVILHEVVGHFGFMRLYGERFPALVDDIMRLSYNDGTIKRLTDDIQARYPKMSREHLAAEIVAHIAETRPKHPFAKRMIAQFREIIRALGFRVNLSRNDLVHLIRKSADAMRHPAGAGYKGPVSVMSVRASNTVPTPETIVMRAPGGDLIAQHNLSAENLRFILGQAGGYLRVPSIAVTRAESPLDGFGEITLLGDANLIDPRGPHRTKVFGADIYSPRYPSVERTYSPAKMPAIEIIRKLDGKIRKELADEFAKVGETALPKEAMFTSLDQELRDAYQEDNPSPTLTAQLSTHPTAVAAYAHRRSGIDMDRLKKAFREAVVAASVRSFAEQNNRFPRQIESRKDLFQAITGLHEGMHGMSFELRRGFMESVEKIYSENVAAMIAEQRGSPSMDIGPDVDLWLKDQLDIATTEKIFQGFDDRTGYRKYKKHTLENVVREMKKNLRGGETVGVTYGTGQVRAQFTPQFKSRRDISANKDRLDWVKYEREKERIEGEMVLLADEVFDGSFQSLQNIADFMVDVGKVGLNGAYRQLDSYNLAYKPRTPELDARIRTFADDLRKMPTEYFEAKILGAVPLSDFKAAVVPQDLDQGLIDALEARGVRVFRHMKQPNNKIARDDAIRQATQEVEGTLFASRPRYSRKAAQAAGQLPLDFDALEQVPLRPDTTQQQIDQGFFALQDLLTSEAQAEGATIIKSAVDDFVAEGATSLIGKRIAHEQDAAAIFQIFRDPRFETLRFFGVDDKNQVVMERAISSRLPGAVSFVSADGERNLGNETLGEFNAAHKRGAIRSLWVMHNHPSGNPNPSSADVISTTLMSSMFEGFFGGQIVVDGDRFSMIYPTGDHATLELPAGSARPDKSAKNISDIRINGPENLATYAKTLEQSRAGFVQVVGTSTRNEVRVVAEFPAKFLATEAGQAAVEHMKRETGSHRALSVGLLRDLEVAEPAVTSGVIIDRFTVDAPKDAMLSIRHGDGSRQARSADMVGPGQTVGSMRVMEPRLDQEGRPIPEGQQDLPGLDTGEQQAQQAPDFGLAPPPGQANAPTQSRLFASRPAGTMGTGFRGPPPGGTSPTPQAVPPSGDRGIDVGGGSYSLKQYGRLDPQEMNVLQSVMRDFEGNIAGERGPKVQTWSETERQALQMIEQKFGVTLDSLINRKPGSAANAVQLEAYAQMLAKLSGEVTTLAERVASQRNPSSEDLASLAQAREKLGMMIAPAMGYATEAGRALNIMRKMAGELRTADDLLAILGDGSENSLKDFAERVRNAGSIDKVIGITRATYTPTWWDKFYEYWINGLLSGPTTHTVNMVSNVIFGGLESVTETVAALGHKDVTLKAAAARVAALPHGMTLGLKNAKMAWVEERAILTPEDKIETDRRAIPGTLGRVIRTPGRALQAEDEFFKAVAYTGHLSALAMDEAIRINPADPMGEHARILGNVLSRPDLIKKAKEQAARVTFTTPLGPIGRAVTTALNKSKVGRIIIPFVRTPTNILKRALEYTPAAPIFAQVRAELAGGGRDQAMAWSRMAVGSSIMMGIASLAIQGLVSGAGPDDQSERAQLMRQGWRPYSVKIGDTWYKYNRLEPTGMLLGLGADMAEIYGVMSDGDYETVASMLMTSLALNLGDKTFLRGISDFAAAYSDPQRYMGRWAQNLATSPIPSIVGQTARWLDPYQREARSLIDGARAKVPGMSQQLAHRLDLAGEPIKRDSGVPGDPFNRAEQREDNLARAMLELGVRKNAVSRNLTVGGRTFELAGQDYESFKGYVQKARWNVLTPMVNSPQFQALRRQNPLQAQALLERQYDEIGRQARTAWIYRNPHVLTDPKKQQRTPTGRNYELR